MPSAKAHVILIDGMSGSGKSQLATHMHAALGGVLVQLDDVYPGWDGMAAGRDHVIQSVLEPISHGESGRYTSWDWVRDAPGDVVEVHCADVVIVEGCGISTEQSRRLADTTVWVECAETERRERLRTRDGDKFNDFLDRWDAQVNAHRTENLPEAHATVVVNTTT